MRLHSLAVIVICFGKIDTLSSAKPYETFLQKYCLRCHGPEKEKGDLRIDHLSHDFQLGADTHHWAEIMEQVNSGEMPPRKDTEPKPTQKEISAFISNLDAMMQQGRAARLSKRPPVAHYRLSRIEYQNTIYDLLGVRYNPAKPGELNEDTLWHGFERIGSSLTLSPSHIDRYYRAADIVLERAFPFATQETQTIRKTALEMHYGDPKMIQSALDRFEIKRPLRQLLFPGRIEPALLPHWLGKSGSQLSGLYRMRIKASGIRPPGGQPAHLSIGKATGEETVASLLEFDISATEDAPKVYEFDVYLDMPTTLHFSVVSTNVVDRRSGGAFRNALSGKQSYLFTHSRETALLNSNAPQMFDDKGNGIFSTVLIDWIEWQGPLVTKSEHARREGIYPPQDASPEIVSEHLRRFCERAWRRPVLKNELSEYWNAYQSEISAGELPSEAFRVALHGVLTSRHFICLVQGDPQPREHLNDWELASRLSYFLWSSMPDDALFTTAKLGKLRGDNLHQEVNRMLTDPKSQRFVEDFARQWLQLHRVGMFPPDKKLYPIYDSWLETSMRQEAIEYFREVFTHNLPIENFIHSDWTMANARLCDFYGLPTPQSEGFNRIQLKTEQHRGGLLTMGAVLGLTSDGTRHRPVHRGVWLSETLLGKTPPPPPANVPAIEPNPPKNPKATLRDKLAAHAQNINCASCHSKIDPLGLAWDNYDAIGQWRTHEKVPTGIGQDPPINPAGELPDGRPFSNPEEFKQLLIQDRETIARAFIEHLCTYALRRILTFDDKEGIAPIVAEAKRQDFRIKDIIRIVALSDLMKQR